MKEGRLPHCSSMDRVPVQGGPPGAVSVAGALDLLIPFMLAPLLPSDLDPLS